MESVNDLSSSFSFPSSSHLSNRCSSHTVPSSSELAPDLELLSLSRLSASLEKLVTDPDYEYSDAEIEVEGVAIGVNRCILAARSDFFHQLFKNEKNEGKPKYLMRNLVDDGVVGHEAFMMVLDYMYTGKVKESPTDVSTCVDASCSHDACGPSIGYAVEMMYASTTFQIKELVMVFQRRLLSFVDKAYVEDVIPILKVAFHRELQHLLSQCLDRIARSNLDNLILEKELPLELLNDVKSLRLKSNQDEEHDSNEEQVKRIHRELDSGDIELVKKLLHETNISLDAACALHYAAAYCNPKIVKEVLDLGIADINLRNSRGYTALHVAARRRDPYVVVLLLEKGASVSDVTIDGRTAIAICRRLTRPKDFKEGVKHYRETNSDRLCIDVLEREMRRNPVAGNVSLLSLKGASDLHMRLLLLENRVAMACFTFPLEARLAMQMAHTDSTIEFAELLAAHGSPVNFNEIPPDHVKGLHLRLQALEKTVETGHRFFPNCSEVLNQLSEDDTVDSLLENGSPEEWRMKKLRYMQLQLELTKALSKDLAEQALTASSSSPSCSTSQKLKPPPKTKLHPPTASRTLLMQRGESSQTRQHSTTGHHLKPPSVHCKQRIPEMSTLMSPNEEEEDRKDTVKLSLPPRKKMKARSDVWDHFTVICDEDGKKKAKCNYCPKTYLCDSKRYGTSSLNFHMKSCIYNPLRKDAQQSELSLKPIGDSASGSVISWKFDLILSRKKLVEMIIKDELAFGIVEGEGFAQFVRTLQPKFEIPSRWVISRDIYQLFLDERVKLREYFRTSGSTVCLNIDTWTSTQKVNYMCITAYYVDKEWNLNKKIIGFCPVESHTGEEMGRQIDDCLREWGIARVLAITVDNASANDTCIDYLRGSLTARGCDVVKGEHLHMRCATHTVNLIVNEGLEVVSPSIKRVWDAIRFVTHSSARLCRFKECCAEENIDCKSLLCLDVPTRWNSTYLMLSAATKFEKAFERFEIEDPHKLQLVADSGVPTPSDWDVARRSSDILSAFYDTTLRVSASLHVTSHLIYHEIDTLGNLLTDWVADTSDISCRFIKEMVEKMQLKFEKYWGSAKNMNKLIYLVVVLDPRYKFKFISFALQDEYGDEEGLRLVYDLKRALNDLYEHYRILNPQSHGMESSQPQSVASFPYSQCSDSHGPPQKRRRYSRSDRFKELQAQSGESLAKTDLEIYLNEETLSISSDEEDFDVLKWWNEHQCRFPILSLVARDILAMPASTVSSEYAFSTGGRTLDPFRSSLTPRIVEGLICTQNWLKRSKQPIMLEEDMDSLEKHEEGITNIGMKEKNDEVSYIHLTEISVRLSVRV